MHTPHLVELEAVEKTGIRYRSPQRASPRVTPLPLVENGPAQDAIRRLDYRARVFGPDCPLNRFYGLPGGYNAIEALFLW